jgi:NAD-dependent dihydropyrimidine dehydrogenase PreA subunit
LTQQSQRLSYRQIMVGRFPTGLSGLEELFASLYEMQRTPGDELATDLVSLARQHNYIPRSAEADFATALLREYRTYYGQRQSGQVPECRCETWQGIPREQIPWFPVVDETQCDGCDKCLEFCANGVYAKRDSGVVFVTQPMQCVVGCDACARLCAHRAITFPPRAVLNVLTHR